MGLENSETIDAMGVEKTSGVVVLTILDSWNWHDVDAHLRALQAKLNTYLDYITSGKILADYPQAHERPLRLDILFRFDVPEAANELLETAHDLIASMGFTLACRKLADPPPTA